MTINYLNSNKQPLTSGGNYEVHKYGCYYLQQGLGNSNVIYLGDFSSSKEAVNYAKIVYQSYANRIDGCYYCCKKSHNG